MLRRREISDCSNLQLLMREPLARLKMKNVSQDAKKFKSYRNTTINSRKTKLLMRK